MTSITYDDVRDVLDTTASETPDSDLDPEKAVADGIVTDDLDPHATLPADQDALDDVAAYLAAAFHTGEGNISQLSQGSRQISFAPEGRFNFRRIAIARDPTNRLSQALSGLENTGRYTGSATPE